MGLITNVVKKHTIDVKLIIKINYKNDLKLILEINILD